MMKTFKAAFNVHLVAGFWSYVAGLHFYASLHESRHWSQTYISSFLFSEESVVKVRRYWALKFHIGFHDAWNLLDIKNMFPVATLRPGGLRHAPQFPQSESAWDLCCMSSRPLSLCLHFPFFPFNFNLKNKGKKGPNILFVFSSWFYPRSYFLDIRYPRFKEVTNFLWNESSRQLLLNSFSLTNRSKAMVSLCTKDPKRALTQSDNILSIAQYIFIANNHTETYRRQTEGKWY